MLFTVTVRRPGESEMTWLFDDVDAARRAKKLAEDTGIYVSGGAEYITDFDEFADWVRRQT
jgi:hypothetical protein